MPASGLKSCCGLWYLKHVCDSRNHCKWCCWVDPGCREIIYPVCQKFSLLKQELGLFLRSVVSAVPDGAAEWDVLCASHRAWRRFSAVEVEKVVFLSGDTWNRFNRFKSHSYMYFNTKIIHFRESFIFLFSGGSRRKRRGG